jgi:uncharacterized membrane protein
MKTVISRTALALGSLWILAAVALPWFGFDVTLGGVSIHLHSLKNPTGAIFLLLGLVPLVPTWRRWFMERVNLLEHWGAEARDQFVWGAAGITAILLCDIKLYQHFSLQTHAFDFGIFANVCWNTLHGRFLYDSVKGASYFADHFQPILFLLSGVLLAWNNTGVFMLVQALGFAFGIPPLFRLTEKATGSRILAVGLCLVYLTRPAFNRLNVGDFHPETLAAPILLWALWFLDQEKPVAFWACCLLSLSLKEDAPVGLAALGLALAFTKTGWRKTGGTLLVVSIAVFLFDVFTVIPHFLHGVANIHFHEISSIHFDRYYYLGNSYREILNNMVRHPIHFFHLVASPPAKEIAFFGYLGSFGFLPLLAPAAFFPAFAAILPHLVSGYSGQYVLNGQYTAFSLPFILDASAKGMGHVLNFLKKRNDNAAAWLFAACLVLSGGGLLTNPRYARPVDWNRLRQFYQLIETIPPQASVRAQDSLLPHVCLRKNIFLFAPDDGYQCSPLYETTRIYTDYVLLDPLGETWPMDKLQYELEVLKLSQEEHYRLIDRRAGYELWERNLI